MCTSHGKTLAGEKLTNFENHVLLVKKFSSPIFTDTPKMYLAYALTVTYLPNSSSPIALICMVCPLLKFSSVQ